MTTILPTFSGSGFDPMPTLSAYRNLVARCRGNVDALLPEPDPLSTREITRSQRTLGLAWRSSVVPLLDQVEPLLEHLAKSVAATLADQTRTEDYRATARTVLVSSATAKVTKIGTQIGTAVDALLAKSERLALPSRPQPQDAVQEARIAGIKSDLTMLTAATTGDRDAFVARLGSRLTAAVADNDALAAWLLCSDWPISILAVSAGFDDHEMRALQAQWTQRISDTLATAGGDAYSAISTYRALSDTQGGLPVLKVATGGFLAGLVSTICQGTSGTERWRSRDVHAGGQQN